MKRPHNYKTERNEEIYNRRKAGETFTAIGKALGMSKNRAREVFRREEGRISNETRNSTTQSDR